MTAMTRRRFLRSAATCGAIATRYTHAACRDDAESLRGFDSYLQRAMADWQVPGIAIAVVRDGKLLLARGYGMCRLGETAPVDAHTLFPIASCTKSFTAAALARLVDQGRLRWDDSIAEHVPSLALPDFPGGARPTIRQALGHRTGLPTANMIWRSGEFDAEQILQRVRFLKPVAAPGEKLLYNNVMYLAAGKAVEQISGRTWSEFIRTEFFASLDMTASTTTSAEIAQRENVASPHATFNGRVQVIERRCPDVTAPTGGIHSSVVELANWLLLHLNRGCYCNRRLLSAVRFDEMHTPAVQTAEETTTDRRVPKAPISRYGMGWFVNTHDGRTIVEHSGTQNGFVAWMSIMPHEGFGVVILSNHQRTGINLALRSWVFDKLLGRSERDWSTTVRNDYENGWQKQLREAEAAYTAQRPPEVSPSRPLVEYAGDYESPLYGVMHVMNTDGGLTLRFGRRFQGTLEYWEQDSFRASFPDPMLHDWKVTFSIDRGQVAAMHVREAPWAPEWYDDRDDLGVFRRH